MKHLPILKVAVVGHTNTGKTSLLRTLTRNADFGQVSNRSGTTRHVEGTSLLVNGVPLLELYDTPGLEDSIGLLEHLDTLRGDRWADWLEVIRRFLDSPAAKGEFEQEAKVLRQILNSDVALYVIDVRDRVLGKHRDELEILGRCARPVVPVLNFVASPEAKTDQWREHLAKVNMHAVAEFDTVILNKESEQRLFEKMQTLLDRFHGTLSALIDDLQRQRRQLLHASGDLIADLLLDVAAFMQVVPVEASAATTTAMETLKQKVREREQRCVDDLLTLHRFRPDDYAADALPISDGRWGLDLFSPASVKEFGVRASSGAAAGAMAGLAIDAMVGGMSLGAGAATGATIGALYNTLRRHGRRLTDRFRGFTELRVDDTTLRVLAVRQLALVRALFRRGHASQDRIKVNQNTPENRLWTTGNLPEPLARAKVNPDWSRLCAVQPGAFVSSGARVSAKEDLAQLLETAITEDETPTTALVPR